jgi:O-antigen ligase
MNNQNTFIRPFQSKIIWALVVLLLFFASFEFKTEISGISISLTSIIIWAIFFIAIVRTALAPSQIRINKIYLFFPWLLLVIFAIISFSLGDGNIRGLIQGIWASFRNIELLLIYPIMMQVIRDKNDAIKLLKYIVYGLSLASIIGVIQTVSGGRLLSGLSANGNHRYLGLFYPTPFDPANVSWQLGDLFRAHGPSSAPNMFASIINLAVLICLAFLMNAQLSSKNKIIWISFLFINLLGLVLSMSRTGWVALFLSVLFVFLIYSKFSLKQIAKFILIFSIPAVLGVTAIAMLSDTFLDRIATILNPFESLEVQGRIEVWNVVIQEIQNKPLVGWGTDRVNVSKIYLWGDNPPIISPHNLFLSLSYQYGLVYFFVTMFFMFRLFWHGIKFIIYSNDNFVKIIGFTSLGFVSTLSIHGMLDSLLSPAVMIIYFWTIQSIMSYSVEYNKK